jgi:hypothetical protein
MIIGKTLHVPFLSGGSFNLEGIPADQRAGPSTDPALQGLRPEVHADPSETAGRYVMAEALARLVRDLGEAVAGLLARTRQLYYQLVLLDRHCPACDGRLEMVRDGLCRCEGCGRTLDPTATFQRCDRCDGTPALRIRRYQCRRCGSEIVSRFLFDGLVFDAEYFRQKMTEHRERRAQEREQAVERIIYRRSQDLPSTEPIDLGSVAGLLEALNNMTGVEVITLQLPERHAFNLRRYQDHILRHVSATAISLDEIPPLEANGRLDRIWRFVAVVFLAHLHKVSLQQQREQIWVMPYEDDGEGQGISGVTEEVDGVKGPVGRSEA